VHYFYFPKVRAGAVSNNDSEAIARRPGQDGIDYTTKESAGRE